MPTRTKPKWQQDFEEKAREEIAKQKPQSPQRLNDGFTGTALSNTFGNGLTEENLRNLNRLQEEFSHFGIIEHERSSRIKRQLFLVKMKLRNKLKDIIFWIGKRTIEPIDHFLTIHVHPRTAPWYYKFGVFQLKHPMFMFFFRRVILYSAIFSLSEVKLPTTLIGIRTAILIIIFFLVEAGAFLNKRQVPRHRIGIDAQNYINNGEFVFHNFTDHPVRLEIYDTDNGHIN